MLAIPTDVLTPVATAIIGIVGGMGSTILSRKLKPREPANTEEWQALLHNQKETFDRAMAAKDEMLRLWRDDAIAARGRFNRLERSTQHIVDLSSQQSALPAPTPSAAP